MRKAVRSLNCRRRSLEKRAREISLGRCVAIIKRGASLALRLFASGGWFSEPRSARVSVCVLAEGIEDRLSRLWWWRLWEIRGIICAAAHVERLNFCGNHHVGCEAEKTFCQLGSNIWLWQSCIGNKLPQVG